MTTHHTHPILATIETFVHGPTDVGYIDKLCGTNYQWRWFQIKSGQDSLQISSVETITDCANQCTIRADCTAFEYSSIARHCDVHVHGIEDEKDKNDADKQSESYQTCVKVPSMSCDALCGCGWYSSTKNLQGGQKVGNQPSAEVRQPDCY